MTCCGVRLPAGRRHCGYCRVTIGLINARRCVSCTAPVTESAREEGLCLECRSRRVKTSPASVRLLIRAAKARHAARARSAARLAA